MIVDELKKSIYLSAFKGNLSNSDNNDTQVEKLLNTIIENKKIDTKEIKKRKISREYNNIYEVPSTWKWVKLGFLCDVVRGLTFSESQKEKTENNILVLRGGNIDSKTEQIIYDDNIYVNKTIPNDNQYLLHGDTLIVASSGTKTSVGKSSYIDHIDENVSFGGFMMVVRPYSEILNPKYLSYNIKIYRNKIINDTNGYISNITNEILNNLEIPLPPIEEQQRIVDKIEELFAKLDEIKPIEQELTELKIKFGSDMRKSILQSATSGLLSKQDSTENAIKILDKINKNGYKINPIHKGIYDIPNNWVWVKFGDLVSFSIGKTPPRADSLYWNKNDYNWVSIADMVDYGIINDTKEYVSSKASDEIFKNKISPKGTLLMSFKLTVGRCSILNIDSFHNEGIISIYPNFKSDILKKYLFNILPYITKFGNKKGAIKGNTLNSKSLDELLIPLPPLEEQQRIVKKIEELLPLCDDIEKLINE